MHEHERRSDCDADGQQKDTRSAGRCRMHQCLNERSAREHHDQRCTGGEGLKVVGTDGEPACRRGPQCGVTLGREVRVRVQGEAYAGAETLALKAGFAQPHELVPARGRHGPPEHHRGKRHKACRPRSRKRCENRLAVLVEGQRGNERCGDRKARGTQRGRVDEGHREERRRGRERVGRDGDTRCRASGDRGCRQQGGADKVRGRETRKGACETHHSS